MQTNDKNVIDYCNIKQVYKIILNCENDLTHFYENCGLI